MNGFRFGIGQRVKVIGFAPPGEAENGRTAIIIDREKYGLHRLGVPYGPKYRLDIWLGDRLCWCEEKYLAPDDDVRPEGASADREIVPIDAIA